ncbi:MAG: O-antigen ligase family protein [Phycisphaerales bacterium]|nr:O-antigen ligase family protein [Phycisphaerales bacterium]
MTDAISTSGTANGTSPPIDSPKLGAMGVLLACTLSRCVVSLDPFPIWSGDPTLLATPQTSLGPTGQFILDTISLLAAALVLWRSRGLSLWSPLLLAVGSVATLAHAFVIEQGSLDNLRVGISWCASLSAGLAGLAIARDRACRALAWGALLALVMMLASKGAFQYFVEHPETVRAYKQHRQQFLEAQGWSEGSMMARAFERRLYQNEGTAWFGLSNVFASLCAGGTVAMLALAGASRRVRDDLPQWVRPLIGAGLIVAGAGLALSMSKGGIAACAVGVALLILGAILRHTLQFQPSTAARLGAALGLLVVAGMLMGIVIRGLIGEKLSELSIYFRWFYIQGATRIFADHPLLGVGPADFKDAYLLAKPALSPEEVTSPHSILFDWLSTLGLAGLAWCLAWLGWVAATGRSLLSRESLSISSSAHGSPSPGTWSTSNLVRAFIVIILAPTALSAFIELQASTPDASIARLVAAALALGVGVSVASLIDRLGVVPAGLSAAALALAAHAQIEVTPVWPGSGAWMLMLCALCAGNVSAARVGSPDPSVSSGQAPAPPPSRPPGARVGALITLALAIAAAFGALRMWTWESKLREAADLVTPIAEVRAAYLDFAQSGHGNAGELAAMLGSLGVKATLDKPDDVMKEIAIVQFDRAGRAAAILKDAGDRARHAPTLQAASKLWMQRMAERANESLMLQAGDEAALALSAAERATELCPTTTAWNWLGMVRREVSTALGRRETLVAAATAFEAAAQLDPHGITSSLELVRVLETLGDKSRAAEWAQKVLDADRNMRLDPLRLLDPSERSHLEGLAKDAGGP